MSELISQVPILEVKNIKKYFKVKNGQLHAVDDINFAIQRGKTLGIVGESGCGKSTLGRAILRLTEPTGGEVFFKGEDILKLDAKSMSKKRQEMQIIFQDPYASINPRMSVSEIIAEPLLVNHVLPDKNQRLEYIDQMMETVGLTSRLYNAYPHELDGGRRQRIGIARALSLKPDFIVCDEPVSALDVSIQAQILNLLMDLQDKMGLTYLFITHDLSVVKHISDEIAVLYLGQCVEKAAVKELFAHPMHPYTRALLSAIPVPNLSMREKKIQIIKGEVPSPVNPASGCRFATRCLYCKARCTEENPIFRQISSEHFIACHYAEELV